MQGRRISIIVAALVAVALGSGCKWFGGDDNKDPCLAYDPLTGDCITTPTPTPTPAQCPFIVTCTPLAGAAGFYVCGPDVAGNYTAFVNGEARSMEFGQLVTAQTGDTIQGCRPCGCSIAAVVR